MESVQHSSVNFIFFSLKLLYSSVALIDFSLELVNGAMFGLLLLQIGFDNMQIMTVVKTFQFFKFILNPKNAFVKKFEGRIGCYLFFFSQWLSQRFGSSVSQSLDHSGLKVEFHICPSLVELLNAIVQFSCLMIAAFS